MEITHDHPQHRNEPLTSAMIQTARFGEVAYMKSVLLPWQFEAYLSLGVVFDDMLRLRNRLNVPSYELTVNCESREEFDFVFEVCIKMKNDTYLDADAAFVANELANSEDYPDNSESLPGDDFRYWVRMGDDNYIGINVKWVDEPATEPHYIDREAMAYQD